MKRALLGLVFLVPIAAVASMVVLLVYRLVFSASSPEERALADAVVAHDRERVSELLASGANPSTWVATLGAGGGSSCRAALLGLDPDRPESIEILALVLDRGCDPDEVIDDASSNSSTDGGRPRSALEWAADCCLAAVEVLLEAGADPALGGARALIQAIESRRGESTAIARRLLDAGIDVNARDYQGRTPLAVAVGEIEREVVDLLESRGATEW